MRLIRSIPGYALDHFLPVGPRGHKPAAISGPADSRHPEVLSCSGVYYPAEATRWFKGARVTALCSSITSNSFALMSLMTGLALSEATIGPAM
jgi:hypothetical protein